MIIQQQVCIESIIFLKLYAQMYKIIQYFQIIKNEFKLRILTAALNFC